MTPTLRITITMTDGAVLEVEEDLDTAKSVLDSIPKHGCRDPRTAKFYPAGVILAMEVSTPPEPIRFSDN